MTLDDLCESNSIRLSREIQRSRGRIGDFRWIGMRLPKTDYSPEARVRRVLFLLGGMSN